MGDFSGPLVVVGVVGVSIRHSTARGDPSTPPPGEAITILPNSSTNPSPPSPLFTSPSARALALARATILARILASLAANRTGSCPSHSFSCVAE